MHVPRTLSPLDNQRWRPDPSPPRPPLGQRVADDAGVAPVLLVFCAVLFNAGLAIINGHIAPLSANVVIGMEVAVVAAAHAIILRHYRPQMLPWYGMIVVVVLFALERAIVIGAFDPKYVRDVLLIPTFVLLGMATPKHRLTPLIVVLHLIVVAGVLFEAYFTPAYSHLFDVREYYIATRPFQATDFWNASSDLFVSATRPEERFFNFVDFHRISSVFLEPVSLGNYVVIITAFICAYYRQLSVKVRAFLIIGNLIALIGCDGRFAAVSSALIIMATFVAPWLPRRSALLYLPLVLAGAVIFVLAAHPDWTQDNFPGRVAYGVEMLRRYEVWEWFGNSDRLVGPAADSGIAYTITTQSIVGLAAFWVFLVLNAKERTVEQIKYLHALCIYIALTMLVSYSLYSIKTAALLWFIQGSFQRTSVAATALRRDREGAGLRPQLGSL